MASTDFANLFLCSHQFAVAPDLSQVTQGVNSSGHFTGDTSPHVRVGTHMDFLLTVSIQGETHKQLVLKGSCAQ